MKILRSILCVAVAILLCAVPFSASAVTVGDIELENGFETDGAWVYQTHKSDQTATIFAYLGSDLNAVIPEKVENIYTVTEVCLTAGYEIYEGGSWLDHFPVFTENIQTLTIPKTIKKFWVEKESPYYANERSMENLKHDDLMIMDGFFYDWYMDDLTAFIVDDENPYFSSKDGVLFNKDQSVLIRYPENKADESYEIPSTVTTIMDYAFLSETWNLKELTIPETITEPGQWASGSSQNTPLEKLIIKNNHITKKQCKQLMYFAKEIVVYENSPVHKYCIEKNWSETKLTVLDNPDPSFAEQEKETEQQTQADLQSPLTGDTTAPFLILAVFAMLGGVGMILLAKRKTA